MGFNVSEMAYCGLWCPACSFKVYSETGDSAHLDAAPARYEHLKQMAREELACGGCKSDSCACGNGCKMQDCAPARGVELCADCAQFPCQAVLDFEGDGAPHHHEGVANLRRIRKIGREAWFEEYKKTLACPTCGRRQSWYYTCDCGGNGQ